MNHEAARYLFVDAMFEIDEIYQCPDCYRHSNEKVDANWFARPCSRKRHELVYAKMTGHPYWPAKVINVIMETNKERSYDVRFFGPGHSRSLVSKEFIQPIDVNFKELYKGKPTSNLQKSLTELSLHRKLLMENATQYSFENENNLKSVKNAQSEKRGTKMKDCASTNGSPKRQKMNNNENTSETLSPKDLQELEAKQRTRGDMQKIIKNLYGTEESNLVNEASVTSELSSLTNQVSNSSLISEANSSEPSNVQNNTSSEELTDPQSSQTESDSSQKSGAVAIRAPKKSPPKKIKKKPLNREQNIGVLRVG